MTNEQLKILINAWARRLEKEIDLAHDKLLESDAQRAIESVYTGPLPILAALDKNPENWKEQEWEFVALLGIADLLDELREAIEILDQKAPESEL